MHKLPIAFHHGLVRAVLDGSTTKITSKPLPFPAYLCELFVPVSTHAFHILGAKAIGEHTDYSAPSALFPCLSETFSRDEGGALFPELFILEAGACIELSIQNISAGSLPFHASLFAVQFSGALGYLGDEGRVHSLETGEALYKAGEKERERLRLMKAPFPIDFGRVIDVEKEVACPSSST